MNQDPEAAGEQEQSEDGEDAGSSTPRTVRRVVCGYRQGSLPGDWLQVWRRLDRTLQRASLKVKATLAPLDALPGDTDIVVIPPDLADRARSAAPPGTIILVTPASAAADAFADLVKRLQEGEEITAELAVPPEPGAPKIVSYRGLTRID